MGPEVAVLDQAHFTIDSKDFIHMAKPNTTPSKKELVAEMTGADSTDTPALLLSVATALDGLTKTVDSLSTTVDEMKAAAGVGDSDDDPKKGEDEYNDELKGEDAGDPDKELSQDEDEDKDTSGMDAIDALSKEIVELRASQAGGMKTYIREVAKRDALYAKASEFIGAVDHTEMTLDELAVYSCDKIGLEVTKGHEITALDAYFHNRPTAVGFDQAHITPPAAKSDGAVSKYFSN